MMEEMVKMVYLDLKDLRERTGKMAETVAMVMMGKMGLQGHPDRQEEMELPELKEIPASRVRKAHLGKTAPREIRASQDPSGLLASKETKVLRDSLVLPAPKVQLGRMVEMAWTADRVLLDIRVIQDLPVPQALLALQAPPALRDKLGLRAL